MGNLKKCLELELATYESVHKERVDCKINVDPSLIGKSIKDCPQIVPDFLNIQFSAKWIQVKNFTTAIINKHQNSCITYLFYPLTCISDQYRNSPYKISTQHQADIVSDMNKGKY